MPSCLCDWFTILFYPCTSLLSLQQRLKRPNECDEENEYDAFFECNVTQALLGNGRKHLFLEDEDVQYLDFNNPELDTEDEMYATKCKIQKQLKNIEGKTLKLSNGKDYRDVLVNLKHIFEEDSKLSEIDLSSKKIAALKEKYGENIKRKERLNLIDGLFQFSKDDEVSNNGCLTTENSTYQPKHESVSLHTTDNSSANYYNEIITEADVKHTNVATLSDSTLEPMANLS